MATIMIWGHAAQVAVMLARTSTSHASPFAATVVHARMNARLEAVRVGH